jgi:hypothetical protein
VILVGEKNGSEIGRKLNIALSGAPLIEKSFSNLLVLLLLDQDQAQQYVKAEQRHGLKVSKAFYIPLAFVAHSLSIKCFSADSLSETIGFE